jgi:four helix bundle protein
MGESILKDKSFLFALHIISVYKELCNRQEYVMSKQMLRSGTSIGANIAEAERGQSTSDFTAKMYISLKEANETNYWIRLLKASSYLDNEEANTLLNECDELIRMLVATTKKTAPRVF